MTELHVNQQILDILQELEYENIQNLVLTTFGRPIDLDKALIRFPNLVKIEVRDACIPDVTTILVEYVKARKGLLKVRKNYCLFNLRFLLSYST